MRETKNYCDVCKREILGDKSDVLISLLVKQEQPYIMNKNSILDIELCEDCFKKMLDLFGMRINIKPDTSGTNHVGDSTVYLKNN